MLCVLKMNVLTLLVVLSIACNIQHAYGLRCYDCTALKAPQKLKTQLLEQMSKLKIFPNHTCQAGNLPLEQFATECNEKDAVCAVSLYTIPFSGEHIEFTHRSCETLVDSKLIGKCERMNSRQIQKDNKTLVFVGLALLQDKENEAKMSRCFCNDSLCSIKDTSDESAGLWFFIILAKIWILIMIAIIYCHIRYHRNNKK